MSCTYDFHGLAAPKSRWPLHHGWVGIGDAQKRFERVRLIWERTEDQKGKKSALYHNHDLVPNSVHSTILALPLFRLEISEIT